MNNKIKHICIITTQHAPDDVRVTHRIAKSFVENGFIVDWYGPPKDGFKGEYGISFHFLKNHNRLKRVFELNKLLNKKKYNIYFAVDPDSAYIASIQASKNSGKSIFDIHERYHDDLLKIKNIKGFLFCVLSTFIKVYMQFVINRVDLAIGVGPSRLEPYKIRKTKTLILGHAVPRSFITNEYYFNPENNSIRRILHGKAALTRGTLKILEAGKLLKCKYGFSDFQIVMFKLSGSQTKSNISDFEKLLEKYGLKENVLILESQPFYKMFKIMNSCDVGLIVYDFDLGKHCVPNRFFEYIATGLPSIYPSFAIDLRAIDDKYDIGIPTDTSNAESIAESIYRLFSDVDLSVKLSKNCNSLFLEVLNWETQSKQLINYLQK